MARRAVLVLLAAVLTGCTTDQLPLPTAPPTATPFPTPTTTIFELNATAWYAGLVIHLDRATSVLDAGGGYVTLDLRLENPGADLASLEAPLLLESAGSEVDPIRGTVIPDVPAGASVGTSIQFDVDGAFVPDQARVRLGRKAEHVVVVPFALGTQDLVTLQPQVFDLAGSGTAGSLSITLTGGELRADLPDWGLELARDSLALTVTYAARYRGDFSGGFAFTGANIGLRLPDKSIISSRPDGRSQSIEILPRGSLVPDLRTRFEVPPPGNGKYGLIVRDGSATHVIPFTIEATVSGG